MTQDLDPSLDIYVRAALGKKALGIVVLDVRALTSISDVFIICHGRSNRQVMAIAEHILEYLKKHKIRPISVEGMKEGHWVLMDYGHVIIHVFYESVRYFYDLEGLWIDAKRVKTESMIKLEEKAGGKHGQKLDF
ncbi:MAG: ribosome silencing factor [Deltaproteobacteria bacterium]|nr:ribosome silencing factor [Deltaproteobacteria bacterium]MBW2151707.1 ribosome silencing factor [Deltaproteobacteria bacterium]